MSTTWDVARANAGVAAYQAHKTNTETTGNVAHNYDLKNQQAQKANTIQFENGIYSSAQSGHFEAAA